METKEILDNAVKKNVISEKDILLLKKRINSGRDKNCINVLFNDNVVYVTDDQSVKGLTYLRRKLLTSKNARRKSCTWGERELKVIGYQGDGMPLNEVNPHKLFTFKGFVNLGTNSCPYVTPIYKIGYISYYMRGGEPILLY